MFKIGKPAKAGIKSKNVIGHDIEASPYVVTRGNKPQSAIKIDSISFAQGELLVEGWEASTASTTLTLWVDGTIQKATSTHRPRADVSNSMREANASLKCHGFQLKTQLKTLPQQGVYVGWKPEEEHEMRLFDVSFPEFEEESDSIVPYEESIKSEPEFKSSEKMVYASEFLQSAIWRNPDFMKVNAHLDRFGIMPRRSGLLAGWVVIKPGWEVWLCDSEGNVESLDKALRYQRQDIVELFRDQFGQHTVDAGFVMPWPYALTPGAVLRLIAYHPESTQAFEVFSSSPEEVSSDPEGYARWAFTVPTPAEKFNERLNRWEGALIEDLLTERQTYFDSCSNEPEVQILGNVPKAPSLSLIIPLYSRWDFVEHQLLAFSCDPALLESTEIIYVVDDPRILTAISNEVENLYRLYEVPFKLVWGHRNRGFSGANNLGVSVSHGRQVLLLNSDAFPMKPGWASQLSSLLDAYPQFGMLGARLLNPEGGIQHAGMVFFYSSSWKVWLNKHPLVGLAPQFDEAPEGMEVIEKPAVTGACVIMTRDLYDKVGGLDEGYLIGDFEDSDLCLKVVASGHKVGYVPGVELVHLERQSFSALGDTSFRTLVVRFNAWRHTQRWGEQIPSVMQRFT
ncbi:glycosyltransferase family 2 protein [Salinicola salarius]|uniref:glycosyltransferase family 2 protein n=1 Tax=Salinicola salarius TaxID=430457 RepID=UPI000DA1A99C|nr:glycosyltransferase [Salinicola salarius]